MDFTFFTYSSIVTRIRYLSHCYSVAWDRLSNHLRLSVGLCALIRLQFLFDFDEILHSGSGAEK